ncbi:MAG: Verru_Chthon cassette protein B [Chthoniobacteraceae bacterium]
MAKFILRNRSLPAQNAFSLVEVTLAIGIVAFAFVSILGLIPVGLANFRSAMENSIESQIIQQVASDLQQSNFSDLKQNQPVRYFDDQGIAKGDSSNTPSNMSGVVYNVNTVVQIPTSGTDGESTNLATIAIEIVKNPGNQPIQRDSTGYIVDQSAPGIRVSRYFTYAANLGQ